MASEADNKTDQAAEAATEHDPTETVEDLYPPADEQAGDGAAEGNASLPVSPEEALEQALAEASSLKDQALRAQAEMENIRRRARRDVEQAHKFALERFADDLLPVLDSLEKAAQSSADDGAVAVLEGVALSLKLFGATFEKSGIQAIDPLGEPFNPEFHEAMVMVENPDAEPNSVMEVMQKGYTLNGRLIRAAKVIVVKDSQ